MGDVQANLEEHVRLARLAAAEGAQVALFPELSLTGSELGLDKLLGSRHDLLAITTEGGLTRAFAGSHTDMEPTRNHVGQSIGFPLPYWVPPPVPPREPMEGRLCRLEPLDP